jgi:Fe-S oxidoreductase
MGNEYVFQLLASGNITTLDRYRPPTIVTACPHCFNTLSAEYPQLGGRYEVVHHSTYLARLVEEGRLVPSGEAVGSVTFHDPCYLARYNDVVADPRNVLRVLPGAELHEMERHGKGTFCCGAGGGRMWMEETRGTRINTERTRQALETGAGTVATACPFCLVMMRDGLAETTSGAQARDIAEVLAASLPPGGPPAASPAPNAPT